MKRLFTVILIGFLTVSFANVEVNGPLDTKMFNKEVNENKSYYETLGEMFQSGSKPEISKLLGVLWAGRCFKKDSPYNAYNGGYHFRKSSDDVGPLGDNIVSYEGNSFWRPNAAPNYFDDKDLSVVKGSNAPYLKIIEKNNGFEINYPSGYKNVLTLSGKYLVLEGRNMKNDVGPLGDSNYDVWARCYYFIPEYTR